MLNSTIKTQSK